ncbi:cytochrome c551 [Alkalihalophilus pseudofirmus OF4]|uniref:Cytochrome c551 n=1 Tax=Alkalihalophilus pseudofirmus (strain ATCC BAA-2126 / JCM 17055 / OF4) TaxID=398511 RepID=D3FYD8_ALKPO|nr:c-type cytochrome [Alkalihalophilus pseudofirmus]ADC49161.1 cytochrome c551 [Alkalihalophilus pseudofirmus OF4]
MKKFLLALGAVVALTACGGGDEAAPPVDEESPAVDEAPADEPADDATAGDYDAESARATYEQSCIACHGGDLQGASGPALVGTGLSAAEIQDIIQNGQGSMPAQNLDDDEAANLAAWLEAQ